MRTLSISGIVFPDGCVVRLGKDGDDAEKLTLVDGSDNKLKTPHIVDVRNNGDVYCWNLRYVSGYFLLQKDELC